MRMKLGERRLFYGNGQYIELKKISGKNLVIDRTGKKYIYNERFGTLKEVIV